MMDLIEQIDNQRDEIIKLRSEFAEVYDILRKQHNWIDQIQVQLMRFEKTEAHALLQAQAATEMAYDQNPASASLLQSEILALLEEHPEGLTTRQIVDSGVCPESRIYKIFCGRRGTLMVPAPDGLLRIEPRVKTTNNGARRFYLEPKKQKLVKHPPAKI